MMKTFADWLQTPIGLFVRDIVEGGVSGAAAAVLALNLDMTSPKGILVAAISGFSAAAIAAARRALINVAAKPTPTP
jgi:hypothetical protein